MKYSFSTEIPVVRPSSRDPIELTEAARILSGDHYTSNVVFGFEIDSVIPRLDPSKNRLKDQWWRESITEGWEAKGWNYDPGTTAQVYLRQGNSVSFLGRVVFMKGGKKLGFRPIGGNEHLLDYYRDMKKLGIYIP